MTSESVDADLLPDFDIHRKYAGPAAIEADLLRHCESVVLSTWPGLTNERALLIVKPVLDAARREAAARKALRALDRQLAAIEALVSSSQVPESDQAVVVPVYLNVARTMSATTARLRKMLQRQLVLGGSIAPTAKQAHHARKRSPRDQEEGRSFATLMKWPSPQVMLRSALFLRFTSKGPHLRGLGRQGRPAWKVPARALAALSFFVGIKVGSFADQSIDWVLAREEKALFLAMDRLNNSLRPAIDLGFDP